MPFNNGIQRRPNPSNSSFVNRSSSIKGYVRKHLRPAETVISKTVIKTTNVMIRTTDVVRSRNYNSTKACGSCTLPIHVLSAWRICRDCGCYSCNSCSFRKHDNGNKRRRYLCRKCVRGANGANMSEGVLLKEGRIEMGKDERDRMGMEEGSGSELGSSNEVRELVIPRANDPSFGCVNVNENGVVEDIHTLEYELPGILDTILAYLDDDQLLNATEAFSQLDASFKFHKERLEVYPDPYQAMILNKLMGKRDQLQPLLEKLQVNIHNLKTMVNWCVDEEEVWEPRGRQQILGTIGDSLQIWMRKEPETELSPSAVSVRGRCVFTADVYKILCLLYDGKLFQMWVPGKGELVEMASPLQQSFHGVVKGRDGDQSMEGEFSLIGADAVDRDGSIVISGQSRESNGIKAIGFEGGGGGSGTPSLQLEVMGGLHVLITSKNTLEITMVYRFSAFPSLSQLLIPDSVLTNIGNFALDLILPLSFILVRDQLDNAKYFNTLQANDPNLTIQLQRRSKEVYTMPLWFLHSIGGDRDQDRLSTNDRVQKRSPPFSDFPMSSSRDILYTSPTDSIDSPDLVGKTVRFDPCLDLSYIAKQCPHLGEYITALAESRLKDYHPTCGLVHALIKKYPQTRAYQPDGRITKIVREIENEIRGMDSMPLIISVIVTMVIAWLFYNGL